MTWNSAYTLYLLLSAALALFLMALALYSWRKHDVPGALPLMISCLFAATWAAASVVEYSAVDLPTKIAWFKFQSCVEAPIVVAATCFILEYAWPGRWLTRRNLLLQGIIPVVWVALALTNDIHHLGWISFHDNGIGPIQAQMGQGAMVLIFMFLPAYTVINLIVFTWLFRRSPQHRWPVGLMLVGQLVGRILYILVKAHVLQLVLPIVLLGMEFEFLMYAFALFGFRILDPIPLARQTAIEQLSAGMLVLDPQGIIASLNPFAERILGTTAKAAQGKSIRELLPAYPAELLEDSLEAETSLGAQSAIRFYSLTVSQLKDFRGLPVGHLLMLRDITEQKQVQAQILEQQRALATLQERERLARELHDELAQELAVINLQAQLVSGLLEAGRADQAREQLQILSSAARDAHVDVRGEISGLSGSIAQEKDLVVGLRRLIETFCQTYGIQTELILPDGSPEISIEPKAEVQLLRIAQEALNNVRKHACAKHVRVALTKTPGSIELFIQDDGVGFDPDSRPASRQTFGLGIMAERAREVGGRVEVTSALGNGTKLTVIVPVVEPPQNGSAEPIGRLQREAR